MKTLIDLGAYTGDSLPSLIRLFGPFDRIVCFEANPALTITTPPGQNVQVVRSAAWIEDGEMDLFLGSVGVESTLMAGKTSGDLSAERTVRVPTLDFSGSLQREIGADERVALKIDIEGAEFEVLERMLKDRSQRHIATLLPEWHGDRLRPRWRYSLWRRWIILRFRLRGTTVMRWSARYLRKKGMEI